MSAEHTSLLGTADGDSVDAYGAGDGADEGFRRGDALGSRKATSGLTTEILEGGTVAICGPLGLALGADEGVWLGEALGLATGLSEGLLVGEADLRLGDALGLTEGCILGDLLGAALGDPLGSREGRSLGAVLGASLGIEVGNSLGIVLGVGVLAYRTGASIGL
jgi:hypothetical protein